VPREYELGAYSVVLLGNFNPSIFSPAWFGRYGLLTDEEVAVADVKVIHSDLALFTVDWLSLRVEQQRFQVQSQVSSIQIRDLVLKTFQDYLSHTPVHSMGINRQVHYKLPSRDHRMRFGRTLAPLEPWGDWGQEIEKGEEPGGLISLSMRQPRPDGPKGYLQVTIQPSDSIPRNSGIYFRANDHYEVASRDNLTGCEEIMTLLDSEFEKSLTRVERILDQVLAKAEEHDV